MQFKKTDSDQYESTCGLYRILKWSRRTEVRVGGEVSWRLERRMLNGTWKRVKSRGTGLAPDEFPCSEFERKFHAVEAAVQDARSREIESILEGGDIDVAAARICEVLNTTHDSDQQAKLARKWVKTMYGVECGMEYMDLPDGGGLWYVNRGDTYDATLCRVSSPEDRRLSPSYTGPGLDDGEWIESCWGEVYEEAQSVRYSETGEQCCAYCGEYAILVEQPDGWACESCGGRVGPTKEVK